MEKSWFSAQSKVVQKLQKRSKMYYKAKRTNKPKGIDELSEWSEFPKEYQPDVDFTV